MNTTSQEQSIHICSKSQGWNYAIDVAEQQIKESEEKIKKLRMSIKTFEEMRAKGEPFPGEEAEQEKSLDG